MGALGVVAVLQVTSLGDLIRSLPVESVAGLFVLAFATCSVVLGVGAARDGLRACLPWVGGARSFGPARSQAAARALGLAARLWLGVGFVLFVLPWLANVAALAAYLDRRAALGELRSASGFALPLLTNVFIGRVALAGRARALRIRAFEEGGLGSDELQRERALDLLVGLHLIVPLLWAPLFFYRFPIF